MVSQITTNTQNTKYQDPLNKPIPVLMSYSNELGTAISEIAPKLGTALWAPTFMYLGADIYDKYKNDKDNYHPSAKRALKQAVFQGLTSLIALPLVILAGQYAVSPIAKFTGAKISTNAKDAIYKHTKDVIDQAHGFALKSKEDFKNIVANTLENKIKARKNEQKTKNIIKKIYINHFTSRYDLLHSNESRVLKFASENAERTFDIMTALKNNNKHAVPSGIYRKYNRILPVMKEMYNEGDYSYQATRTALKEYQSSLIFKNKLLKTLGGFASLILFANPVNDFDNKKIMKEYINPGIDQISKGFVNDSKLKTIFNDLGQKTNFDLKSVKPSNLFLKSRHQHELKSKAAGNQ